MLAIGDGVAALQPGDEVLAVTPSMREGLLASYVTLPAELALRKPANLSFEEAATSPITFLTAYYALIELARMKEGDWVLIHAAAGGVGLAAIEIAKAVGAKIIATVGSKEKEDYVRSLGVQHIFDSRSLDFSAGVMEVTQQRGVDIVLNSLSGEFIARGLDVLAPYGRFLELGKRDIYDDRQVGLRVFRKNISFHVVDLAAALEDRRPYVASLLKLVMDRLERRSVASDSRQSLSSERAERALPLYGAGASYWQDCHPRGARCSRIAAGQALVLGGCELPDFGGPWRCRAEGGAVDGGEWGRPPCSRFQTRREC